MSVLLFAMAFAGCSEPDDPQTCLAVLWHDFDSRYGQFEVKNIDWDGVRQRYRPKLTDATPDDELFDVLSGVPSELNDSHVVLSGDGRRFQSGIIGQFGQPTDFSLRVVKDNYLDEPRKAAAGIITYGHVSDTIGYIHLSAMQSATSDSESLIEDGFDLALAALVDSAGLIIDVRSNPGGEIQVSTALAGRFVDQRRLAFKIRQRQGPRHSDFEPPMLWYVSPAGAVHFSGPVMVLTNRFTVSAAELFTIVMRLLPNVTHVGDLTAGAQDSPLLRELPNRWHYYLPLGLTTDREDNCYEGVGITPQLLITNNSSEIGQGIDRMLAKAISQLQ
jgi:carboxyl-terminal processing protease